MNRTTPATKVKIIIPLYRNKLTHEEINSVNQCFLIYSDIKQIVFVKPNSLSIDNITAQFRKAEVTSFPDEYFQGLEGYNRLMLSREFYKRFEDCEYILIHQTDAYLFEDRLDEWCDKGYDYIGAPWLPKNKYSKLYYKLFLSTRSTINNLLNRYDHTLLHYKVGNGGLSLRKVKTHLAITSTQTKRLETYRKKCYDSIYNEDIFWSTEAVKQNPDFNYPAYTEALTFAFDKMPQEAFVINNCQLPFGCHGWSKPKMKKFWSQYIN